MIFEDLHKAMTSIINSGEHDVMCSMSLKNCHAKGLFSLVIETMVVNYFVCLFRRKM